MSYIPNPFLQGSPDIRHNSPPATPNSAPGFLMMTRPANDCNSVGKTQARRFQGTVRPNHSFNRHHTPHYPSPHDSPNRHSTPGYSSPNESPNRHSTPYYSRPNESPNRHSTPRYSSPNESSNSQGFLNFNNNRGHNQRGLNNRGNGNQRFGLSMDHVSRLQHPYRSTGKANFYEDNNSFSGSPTFHSSPHQFRGQRGRSFGNRNSFSGSHNKSNSFHRTPLKDIPIDKFVSEITFKDPWEDLNSSSEDRSVVLDEPNKNISLLENSQIVTDTGSSINTDCANAELLSGSQSDNFLNLNSNNNTSIVTPSTSEKDTGTESDE